jgi:hypothetical protein
MIRRSIVESSEDERENRLNWAHLELLKEEEEIKRKFSLITAQSVQSLYQDELKRAFRHKASDAQPELNIRVSDLYDFSSQDDLKKLNLMKQIPIIFGIFNKGFLKKPKRDEKRCC